MAHPRRLEELSILNVLFCMLVVFIHVLSHAVTSLDTASWQFALVLIPQRLAFVSVPGFFFLSGVKLTLPREERQTLTNYYRGRAKNLLLPYLLAAAVYYLLFVAVGWHTFSLGQFVRETALGTLSAQFYFFIALIQFILLTPLFRWLTRRYHPVFLLPLALGITWLSSMHLDEILQLFYPAIDFPYRDRVFTSYLVYYMAGCCAGAYYPTFLILLRENRSLFTACTLFFGVADGATYLLAASGQQVIPYLELIHTLYILSAIPALYSLALWQKGRLNGAAARLFCEIDRATYLIYLYHCLVIIIFNSLAPRVLGCSPSTLLLLRTIVVYPVTITACILWQRLRANLKKRKS